MSHISDLRKSIKNKSLILFVGSGISKPLGLPTFAELIDQMAEMLGYDPSVFRVYGDFRTLAEYFYLEQGSIGPLRSWLDRKWHKSEINIENSKIHKAIVDLNIQIIYTTNYDEWIERAFKHYGHKIKKIVNVRDLCGLDTNTTQVVKFHGDFSDDESLVLKESTYYERIGFEHPLDIKLKNDIIGKMLLFIGYSLSDINIRCLLYKVDRLWRESKYATARPYSYIFLNRPNPVQERVLENWRIKSIISDEDDPEIGLHNFLNKLQ